jgi:hypothetical protein
MLEVKVTRKCNICGKIMSKENYWSCEQAYAENNEYVKQQSPGMNLVSNPQPTKTDVCLGCWEKMREQQEPKGHP